MKGHQYSPRAVCSCFVILGVMKNNLSIKVFVVGYTEEQSKATHPKTTTSRTQKKIELPAKVQDQG